MTENVSYHLLGPVGLAVDGIPTPIESGMVRGLLAALLTGPGRIITTTRLLDMLWDTAPDSAEANLRGYVTRLRRLLPESRRDDLITRRGVGYGLMLNGATCDLYVFRNLMTVGRRLGGVADHRGAARQFRAALALWDGPAGDDLPDSRRLATVAADLNTERLDAIVDLAVADLRLGDGHAAAAGLSSVVTLDPGRERAWAMLARAHLLTRGRSTALRTVDTARRRLADVDHRQPHPYLDRLRDDLLAPGALLTISPTPLPAPRHAVVT